MPFRSQEYVERCRVCEQPAPNACPQCQVPICAVHACEPHGSCERCAVEMYFAVSRAGQRQVLGGSAIAFVSTIAFYTLNALCQFPPLPTTLLALGVLVGTGAVLWGGSISPRLTERAMLRRPQRRRLLGALRASPAGSDAADDRSPAGRSGRPLLAARPHDAVTRDSILG